MSTTTGLAPRGSLPAEPIADPARLRAVVVLAGAWVLVFSSARFLRPMPHEVAWWGTIPETVFWGSALWASLGVVRDWRGGLLASFLALATIALCPVVGHHDLGMWFPVQLGGACGLIVANGTVPRATDDDPLPHGA